MSDSENSNSLLGSQILDIDDKFDDDDEQINEFFVNQNNENNKEELKKLFLEEIFYQKNTAAN